MLESEDKLLYLMVFSLYSGLFWELRDIRNLKKFIFDLKGSEPCRNIDISNVAKHRVMFVHVTFFVVKYSKRQMSQILMKILRILL